MYNYKLMYINVRFHCNFRAVTVNDEKCVKVCDSMEKIYASKCVIVR